MRRVKLVISDTSKYLFKDLVKNSNVWDFVSVLWIDIYLTTFDRKLCITQYFERL